MKTNFKLYTALTAVCVLLVLAGCNEINDFPVLKGGGKLVLSINTGASRTIQPGTITFTEYFLEFLDAADGTPLGGAMGPREVPANSNIIEIDELRAGTYKLHVTARINGQAAAEGTSANFIISENSPAAASVKLAPKQGENGTFAWNINLDTIDFPGGTGVTVSLKIGTNAAVTLDGSAADKSLHGSMLLPTGRYDVVFSFTYGGKTVDIPELLDIFPHATSTMPAFTLHAYYFTKDLIDAVIGAIKAGGSDYDKIAGAHFSLLAINTGTDFEDIRDDILALHKTEIALTNKAELTLLIDAALVREGFGQLYDDEAAAKSAAEALVKNGSAVTASTTETTVTIKIGGYEITTRIPYSGPVYVTTQVVGKARSEAAANEGIEKALDGDINSRFVSGQDSPMWLKFDLGAEYELGGFEYLPGQGDDSAEGGFRQFQIYIIDKDFFDAADASGTSGALVADVEWGNHDTPVQAGNFVAKTFGAPVTTRYLLFNIASTWHIDRVFIREIKFRLQIGYEAASFNPNDDFLDRNTIMVQNTGVTATLAAGGAAGHHTIDKAVDGNIGADGNNDVAFFASSSTVEIVIDLGAEYDVAGLEYYGRQDGGGRTAPEGFMTSFNLYRLEDSSPAKTNLIVNKTWTPQTINNGRNAHTVSFTPVKTRYLLLEVLSTMDGNVWMAELFFRLKRGYDTGIYNSDNDDN